MRRTLAAILSSTVFFVLTVQGVVPQKWETRSKDEFLKGKFDRISVTFDGILSLSLKEEKIEGPAEDFYLSLLLTEEEVAFLGTGHGGKIYRIRKGGEPELYFQVPEMDILCLAQDKKGNLYAGTSPNGKIWKITDKDKGDIFFDPREKYIWDLLFTEKGTLLAAVGENGGIYEISPQGEGRLAFKAEENHILCMKMDKNGDIIAGSGGRGLLYRISQTRKASILFESPYEEIKNITLDVEGNIYIAAGGTPVKPKSEPAASIPLKTETEVTVSVTPMPAEAKDVAALREKQPGAVYRVSRDGVAKKLWHSEEELIYSLAWNEGEKKLIFGTGNQGRLYSLMKDEKVSLVFQKKSEQVYGLFPFHSKIYILSNNPSVLNILYPEQVDSGEYLSRVLDTGAVSSWGRIEWDAETPVGTSLQFETRSGNSSEPSEMWSDWSPPYQKKEGEKVLNPRARYIQFKVMFKSQSAKTSPLLQRVSLFYLQTNVPPLMTEIGLLAPNEVYLKPPEQQEVVWGADVGLTEAPKIRAKGSELALAKKIQRKGFQTVTWDADDENGDDLVFSISIRREDEKEWRPLKEKWTDIIYAFDTVSFPDGVYFLKIVASDAPSNPSGSELKSEKVSRPVVVDNSLPVIKNFQAVRGKNALVVTFLAEDSMSYIAEVKYLLRPDDWQSVFPEDGICDSKQESFKITIPLVPGSDNLITVSVKDSLGNVAVYRQTF